MAYSNSIVSPLSPYTIIMNKGIPRTYCVGACGVRLQNYLMFRWNSTDCLRLSLIVGYSMATDANPFNCVRIFVGRGASEAESERSMRESDRKLCVDTEWTPDEHLPFSKEWMETYLALARPRRRPKYSKIINALLWCWCWINFMFHTSATWMNECSPRYRKNARLAGYSCSCFESTS